MIVLTHPNGKQYQIDEKLIDIDNIIRFSAKGIVPYTHILLNDGNICVCVETRSEITEKIDNAR
jgi:uncharacterized protein YlzI (FlbEa/FlbD family)